jgi:hypothetical protein
MLTLEVEKFDNMNFMKPMRAIFSGSSQSGKTRLIGKILKNQIQLFGEKFELVKYFYPEYLEECPVDWHNDICIPISYQPGFPDKNDILSMPSNSLLIVDDNMAKVVKSELMRQLFNVISGKKNISVICVTQNYFTQGPHSRDIRNSANYVGLFRNCADASLNKRVATAFGLGKAYQKAEEEFFPRNIYPYVFIDQTQRAQISSYRLYVNIFKNPRIAYSSSGMRGYILGEKEFNAAFQILQEKKNSATVVLNENKKINLSGTKRSPKGGQTKNKSGHTSESASGNTTAKWRKYQRTAK